MLRQGADVGSGRLGGAKLEETVVWSIKGPGRSPARRATFPDQREGEYRPSSSFAETKRPEPTSAPPVKPADASNEFTAVCMVVSVDSTSTVRTLVAGRDNCTIPPTRVP